jgi:hypothetical protein
MNLSRTLILVVALGLAGCDSKDVNHYIYVLQGAPDPAEEQAAFVEPAAVGAVASSSEEVCEVRMWRFMLLDCHDNNLGPAPGYE